MRVNPGGVLAPEDVIGRDDLISRLWDILEGQSVVLTSERRVGKTSVIRKMAGAPGTGRLCVFRDVEGYRTAAEFVEGIYLDIEPQLSRKERARQTLWSVLQKLGGAEIADIKLPQVKQHWKKIMWALFEDLLAEETRPVIFFWDELPLFLYSVKTNAGEQDAMEMLDALRGLRQKYVNLRMVYTGSVGIHQVIGSLRKHGYANDPTNDMATIEVPPLEEENGSQLASLLLEGERIRILDDREAVGRALTKAAGHIPYYIHCLVSRIRDSKGEIQSDGVRKCLHDLISDPDDPAHFSYYHARLKTYYTPIEADLALNALDILAAFDKPVAFADLLNLVRHQTAAAEKELFRQVMQALLRDHYVVRDAHGGYSFRYSIVKNWWAYTRG